MEKKEIKNQIEKHPDIPDVINNVLNRVGQLVNTGELSLPENYSSQNAVKAAWLILEETQDKNNNSVLKSCSKTSIVQSLLKMVIYGVTPIKNQCWFIPYGEKLNFQLSYDGKVAIAKRDANVKDVIANIIFEDDNFEYQIDPDNGHKKIVKHEQNFANIDINKIKGAYATVIFNDDRDNYVEIMTINQIKQSWLIGAAKGASSAHKNTPDQMAIRTVKGRALKPYIRSTDDSMLFTSNEKVLAESKQNDISDTDFEDVTNEDTEPVKNDVIQQINDCKTPEQLSKIEFDNDHKKDKNIQDIYNKKFNDLNKKIGNNTLFDEKKANNPI